MGSLLTVLFILCVPLIAPRFEGKACLLNPPTNPSTSALKTVFFETLFVTRPWKALFVSTDDDIGGWWQRWNLDRYSIFWGAGFGYVQALGQSLKVPKDSGGQQATGNSSNSCKSCCNSFKAKLRSGLHRMALFLTAKRRTSWICQPLGAVASVAGIAGYSVYSLTCKDKAQCNLYHPYIVIFPICGYVYLRNMTSMLRSGHSAFFAWFGRINLEMFIAQYHIWLAADSHGVLVLIPNYPVVNILLTSFIFLCICHEIHMITGVLSRALIPPNNPKVVARNAFFFLLLLIPIAVNDGMF